MNRRGTLSAVAMATIVGILLIPSAPVGATTPAWSIEPVPTRAGALASGLDQVSCLSASFCMAVGDLRTASGRYVPLAERWNKSTWRNQTVPNPVGAKTSGLSGISCISKTACMAVGVTGRDGLTHGATLAEQWNGTAWAIQPTPSVTGGTFPTFTGVSCTSPTNCIAVGNYTDTGKVVVSLAEQWNGVVWTIQPTPIPTGAWYSYLSGVSCSSATSCTAVGYSNDSRHFKVPSVTLVEQWNGAAWSIQSTPDPIGAVDSSLSGVSCTSATACMAVGDFTVADPPDPPDPCCSDTTAALIEQWNGTAWAIQSTPDPTGAVSATLTGVSCTSATACTAIGTDNTTVTTSTGSESVQLTLAERWNGAVWSIQPTPDPAGAVLSYLNGTSCSSVTVCTAVGYYLSASDELSTLAERRS